MAALHTCPGGALTVRGLTHFPSYPHVQLWVSARLRATFVTSASTSHLSSTRDSEGGCVVRCVPAEAVLPRGGCVGLVDDDEDGMFQPSERSAKQSSRAGRSRSSRVVPTALENEPASFSSGKAMKRWKAERSRDPDRPWVAEQPASASLA